MNSRAMPDRLLAGSSMTDPDVVALRRHDSTILSPVLIVDRVGIRVLRDPTSAKPYLLFYTTKRVGGGVQDFNAIKRMKLAVS